jgi:hypothetical protein
MALNTTTNEIDPSVKQALGSARVKLGVSQMAQDLISADLAHLEVAHDWDTTRILQGRIAGVKRLRDLLIT